MSVRTDLSLSVRVVHANAAAGLSTYTGTVNKKLDKILSTADVSKVYHAARTISGTSETLDLTSGLTDAYGAALVFGTLKYLLVYNTHATVYLDVGGGSNPVLANAVRVTAGGWLDLNSVFTVDGTHKNLLVTGSTTGGTYQLILVG